MPIYGTCNIICSPFVLTFEGVRNTSFWIRAIWVEGDAVGMSDLSNSLALPWILYIVACTAVAM
jgi:hypothetical protein